MAVVCLFTANTISWAYPPDNSGNVNYKLARWSLAQNMAKSGVQDKEAFVEAVCGIQHIAKHFDIGACSRTANAILNESSSASDVDREITFFDGGFKNDNGTTRARYLTNTNGGVYEIAHSRDGEISIVDLETDEIVYPYDKAEHAKKQDESISLEIKNSSDTRLKLTGTGRMYGYSTLQNKWEYWGKYSGNICAENGEKLFIFKREGVLHLLNKNFELIGNITNGRTSLWSLMVTEGFRGQHYSKVLLNAFFTLVDDINFINTVTHPMAALMYGKYGFEPSKDGAHHQDVYFSEFVAGKKTDIFVPNINYREILKGSPYKNNFTYVISLAEVKNAKHVVMDCVYMLTDRSKMDAMIEKGPKPQITDDVTEPVNAMRAIMESTTDEDNARGQREEHSSSQLVSKQDSVDEEKHSSFSQLIERFLSSKWLNWYFKEHWFEKDGLIYKWLGVKYYKKYVVKPLYRLCGSSVRDYSTSEKYLLTKLLEIVHLIIGAIFILAGYPIGAILVNIPPILVCRYDRIELQRRMSENEKASAEDKVRGQREEHSSSQPEAGQNSIDAIEQTDKNAAESAKVIEEFLNTRKGYTFTITRIAQELDLGKTEVIRELASLEASKRVVRITRKTQNQYQHLAQKASLDHPYGEDIYQFEDTNKIKFALPLDIDDWGNMLKQPLEEHIKSGHCMTIAGRIYLVIRNFTPRTFLVQNCETSCSEVLKPCQSIQEAEFLKEASHENIPRLNYVFFVNKKRAIISTEYNGPVTFSSYIKELVEKEIELSEYLTEAIPKIIDVGKAWGYLRSKGYAYNDYRPGHIIVDEKTERGILIDFGRIRERHKPNVNIIFFAELLQFILSQKYPDYMVDGKTVTPAIPEELDRIARKAAGSIPGEDYQTPEEVVRDLRSFLDGLNDSIDEIAATENIEKKVKAYHNSEKEFLLPATRTLSDDNINMFIDLSNALKTGLDDTGYKDQIRQNSENLAMIMLYHRMLGLKNVRYILENDIENIALDRLKDFADELPEDLSIALQEILSNMNKPHEKREFHNVRLMNVDNLDTLKRIEEKAFKNEFIVALEDDVAKEGVVLPNFKSAAAIGLALAALGRIKEKEDAEDYEREKEKYFKKIKAIYERFGKVLDDSAFSIIDLEFMVSGCSRNKLEYALRYALPPLVKDLVDKVNQHHEQVRLFLMAA
jgi:serine/threonine protein kinase